MTTTGITVSDIISGTEYDFATRIIFAMIIRNEWQRIYNLSYAVGSMNCELTIAAQQALAIYNKHNQSERLL